MLYAAILEHKANAGTAGLYQRGRLQKQAALPAAPRHIPTKHHAFVTALGQTIGINLADCAASSFPKQGMLKAA